MNIDTPAEIRRKHEKQVAAKKQAEQIEHLNWKRAKFAYFKSYFDAGLKKACSTIALQYITWCVIKIPDHLTHDHGRALRNFNSNADYTRGSNELKEICPGGWDELLDIPKYSKQLYEKGYTLYSTETRGEYASLYPDRTYYLTLNGDFPSVTDVTDEEYLSSLQRVTADPAVISPLVLQFKQLRQDWQKEQDENAKQAELQLKKKNQQCLVM